MNYRNTYNSARLMLRAPMSLAVYEGEPGGGLSTPAAGAGDGNNTGGNPAPGASADGTQNNAGTGFDAAAFWKEPAPAGGASPGSSSSASSTPGSAGAPAAGAGDDNANYGQNLNKRLSELNTGGDVFTPQIAEQVASGDLTGINSAIQTQMRSVAQQAVMMSAELMQRAFTAHTQKIQSMIDGGFNNRDNNDTLVKNFPAASDPGVRPMIEGVFNQALKLANGDRTKAVASTREMLKYMGTKAAPDMGLNIPPPGSGDGDYNSPGSMSLVDELLGR